MRHVLVVYNPVAGGSRGERVSARVQERLEAAGHTVRREATQPIGGAEEIVRAASGDVDHVVAVGGDGTVREAVAGLGEARAETTVGVVPMGNANIVAHELDIPRQAERAIDVLIDGRPTPLDLGTVTIDASEEIFLGVVGVGWDADAVGMLDRIRNTPTGRRAYRVWADGLYGVVGVAAAMKVRTPRFRVVCDGAPLEEGPYCAAFLSNLRTYAKAMTVTPQARPASGLMHAQFRRSALLPALVIQMSAALIGRRTPAWISRYVDGARFELVGDQPFPVQVDGDARGETTRLEVGVLPSAVRILAPRAPE